MKNCVSRAIRDLMAIWCSALLFMPVRIASAQARPENTSRTTIVQLAGAADRMLLAEWEPVGQALSTIYQSDNRLVFETPAGTHTVSIAGTPVSTSAGSARRLFAVISRPPQSKDHDERLLLQVYDRSGSPVFDRSLPWSSDEPVPCVAIDEVNHRIIITNPASSELVVLELATGRQVQTISLFKKSRPSLEKSMLVRLSTDASIFVAAMREAAQPSHGTSQQGNIDLLALDGNGKELWRRKPAGPSLHSLAVSPNGEVLAVASYDGFAPAGPVHATQLFSREGLERLQADMLFQNAVWDADANSVVLASRREIRRYDLQRGALQLKFKLQDHSRNIVAIGKLTNSTTAVLLTAQPVFAGDGFRMQAGKLILLSRDGRIIDRRELPAGILIEPYLTFLGNDDLLACHYRNATVVMPAR